MSENAFDEDLHGKRAEERLHESEERYRSLFENMRDGLAYCKMLFENNRPQDFIYLEVNSAFEELTGLKNVVGRKVTEVIPGIRESNPELFEVYGRVALSGKPERLETYIETLGIWFSISVYCPRREYFVAVFDTITERKSAEEGLKLFRALIDRSNDFIEVVDPETARFLDINEKACIELGYSREEFLSLKVFDVDPTVDQSSFARAREEIRKSGFLTWKGNHKRKDGSTFPAEVNLQYVRFGRDYILAVVRDITERKRVEEQLRKLSRAIEQSPSVVMITDAQGNIEYVNPRFTGLTGYSADEVMGKNPRILKSGKTSQEEYRRLWETIANGGDWHGELHNKKKNGDLYWESATISPIRDPEGCITHFLAVKEDISNRINLEEQVRQAQKMESIGALAGGIAHDFNNVLAIIQGYTFLLERSATEPEKLPASIEAINKAVQRGSALVRQLLTFARKTDVLYEPIHVNLIVDEMAKMLTATFPESIVISMNRGDQIPPIIADAGQLHQALLNLCLNARDAMQKGGTLTIMTSARSGAALRETFGDVKEEQYVCISVADTGVGMNEATRRRIFEPFFTTKERGKGTGLGLSVVYGVMKGHEGFIDVESTPGKGTTFLLCFPIRKAEPDTTVARLIRPPRHPGDRKLFLSWRMSPCWLDY